MESCVKAMLVMSTRCLLKDLDMRLNNQTLSFTCPLSRVYVGLEPKILNGSWPSVQTDNAWPSNPHQASTHPQQVLLQVCAMPAYHTCDTLRSEMCSTVCL